MKNLRHLFPKVVLWKKCRKKPVGEGRGPADPSLPGKRPLKDGGSDRRWLNHNALGLN